LVLSLRRGEGKREEERGSRERERGEGEGKIERGGEERGGGKEGKRERHILKMQITAEKRLTYIIWS
jgi:hypothetical protein